VRQPTLIVHAREDDHADINNAIYLQYHLTGMVDLVVLEDSYHLVTLDARLRAVVAARTERRTPHEWRAPRR
jgi:carboxylesterase